MKSLSIRELQLLQLSAMKDIHKYCIENDIRFDITVVIGITSLGKYTFPKIPAFPVNVPDVAFRQLEKYPHVILPAIKKRNDGTPPGARPAIFPKITVKITVVHKV